MSVQYSTECFLFGVGMLVATIVGQWLVIAQIAGGTTKELVGTAILLGICSSGGAFILGGVYQRYVE